MLFKFFLHIVSWRLRYYCAFQKHTNSEVQKSPSQLGVFTAVNHNYDHEQRTLKHKHTKRIEIHQSQTMTF